MGYPQTENFAGGRHERDLGEGRTQPSSTGTRKIPPMLSVPNEAQLLQTTHRPLARLQVQLPAHHPWWKAKHSHG